MITVLASDGSLQLSLLFGGPVGLLLLALVTMTIRERRRAGDELLAAPPGADDDLRSDSTSPELTPQMSPPS
jgi:cytochrome c-type biogenesis protein CcmH/NrfF